MLDVTIEEPMDVQQKHSAERKPFLKFGVSAILGLEQSPDEDETNAEDIRTPLEDRKIKSTAVMLSFDKDVFSDYSVSSAGGGGASGGVGVGSSASAVKNGHPYLHSYFHPLIHASATKPISYTSKSKFRTFVWFIFLYPIFGLVLGHFSSGHRQNFYQFRLNSGDF